MEDPSRASATPAPSTSRPSLAPLVLIEVKHFGVGQHTGAQHHTAPTSLPPYPSCPIPSPYNRRGSLPLPPPTNPALCPQPFSTEGRRGQPHLPEASQQRAASRRFRAVSNRSATPLQKRVQGSPAQSGLASTTSRTPAAPPDPSVPGGQGHPHEVQLTAGRSCPASPGNSDSGSGSVGSARQYETGGP